MAINEIPLAIGGIHREFESDVLAKLQQYDARLHGCPVYKVESKLDGGITVRFKGQRHDSNGISFDWEGGLKITYPLLRDKKWLGDVNAIAETALQILDNIRKETQPVIQRAANG